MQHGEEERAEYSKVIPVPLTGMAGSVGLGLRHDEATIENGIERLRISTPVLGSAIASLNARTCREACKRDQMADAWQSAIFNPEATHSRVVHEVFVPVPRVPSHPVMRHWLRGSGAWFSGLRAWWLERKVSRISGVA